MIEITYTEDQLYQVISEYISQLQDNGATTFSIQEVVSYVIERAKEEGKSKRVLIICRNTSAVKKAILKALSEGKISNNVFKGNGHYFIKRDNQ